MLRVSLVSPLSRTWKRGALWLSLAAGLTFATEAQAQDPPVVTISPRDQVVPSGTVNVTIDWCQGTNMFDESTRVIRLNGVSVAGNFTTEFYFISGCEYSERSTGTVTLTQDGNNSFYAGIKDVNNYLGDDLVTYAKPVAGRGVIASSDAGFVDVKPSTSGLVQSFKIWNKGSGQAKYNLTASCTGAAAGGACVLSTAKVTVDSGAYGTATITYTSKATIADTGLVSLVATDSADAQINDQGWTDVTIVPAPSAGTVVVSSNDLIDRGACVTIALASSAASECGELRLVDALPSVTTMSTTRTPTLIYNSAHIKPKPIVNANVTLPAGTLPTTVEARVFIENVQKGFSSYAGSQWAAGGNTRRVSVLVDASAYPTKRIQFILEIKKIYSGSTSYDSVKSHVTIVNRESSHFGAGWWLAGLEQLVSITPDSVAWVGGDGSSRVYRKSGSYFYGPSYDGRDSISISGTDYIRWAPGRTQVKFNSTGRHITTTNRKGHVTTFHYTSSRLDSLTVPPAAAAKRYKFTYAVSGADTVLSQVTAPAVASARNVTTTRSGKKILTFTDPDTSTVTFTYGTLDNQYRVDSRADKRNKITYFTYDAARRLTKGQITVGGVIIAQDLVAAETRAVPGTTTATAQPVENVYTLINGPRTDVGDSSKVWINPFGAPGRTRDANGKESMSKYHSTWKGAGC